VQNYKKKNKKKEREREREREETSSSILALFLDVGFIQLDQSCPRFALFGRFP